MAMLIARQAASGRTWLDLAAVGAVGAAAYLPTLLVLDRPMVSQLRGGVGSMLGLKDA
jgi:hypothetical protein